MKCVRRLKSHHIASVTQIFQIIYLLNKQLKDSKIKSTILNLIAQLDIFINCKGPLKLIILPGAPQDEAGLHEEIRDEPRGWGHMPNAPDSPVRP